MEDNEQQLYDAVIQLQTQLNTVYSEIRNLQNRLDKCEGKLYQLEYHVAHQPAYINEMSEEMAWLHQRYDEMQRIFDFDSMIINGVQNNSASTLK